MPSKGAIKRRKELTGWKKEVNEALDANMLAWKNAGASLSKIGRTVGLSKQRVHQRITRAQWYADHHPGYLDGLRKKHGIPLSGSSIGIQDGRCEHGTEIGVECLVCSRGPLDGSPMIEAQARKANMTTPTFTPTAYGGPNRTTPTKAWTKADVEAEKAAILRRKKASKKRRGR